MWTTVWPASRRSFASARASSAFEWMSRILGIDRPILGVWQVGAMSDDKRKRRDLRIVPGGRDRHLHGLLVEVVAADHLPSPVDAVAVEDDTYSVLAADPTVREPADHPIRIWNALKDVTEAEPGSVIVKRGRPLKFLAVVHDLAREPTWKEEWVAAALAEVLAECDARGLKTLGLQPLGAMHGTLAPERFVELLRSAIDRHPVALERIWIVAPPTLSERLSEGLAGLRGKVEY